MLIDSHAHIFDLDDCQSVIDNLSSDGLESVITVGYDLKTSSTASKLALQNDRIYAAVGVHPSYASGFKTDTTDNLYELIKQNPKIIAVGEIGLDYHYENFDKAAQTNALCSQLDLVCLSGLPVIFHIRDAYADMLEIIKQNRSKIKNNMILHCFSGSKEIAQEFISLGCYLSFTGAITFNNAKKAPEILRSLPKDRVLIETDCPYLAPQPFRGQTNYPKNVRYVAQKLAAIWDMDFEGVAQLTVDNTKKAFNLK